MNAQVICELKETSTDKVNQGDVRVYSISKKPKAKLALVKDPVLVYGQSGNHHKLVGGSFTIKRDKESGIAFIEVKRKTTLVHEQHGPHELRAGIYLVDRAREKGMVDDLIAPVQD